MHHTVATWEEFRDAWDGVHNFRLAGECVPFGFDFPPLARIVDELRVHPEARLGSGARADRIKNEQGADFRTQPLSELLAGPFSLSHFRLSAFDEPGRCLHGFGEKVFMPWLDALRAQGFTWERCYPIIFISGAGAATNYHMDFSHVLAWQIHGRKRFCGLKAPGRWAPHRTRVNYRTFELVKPSALTEDDALCYDMGPGDTLWNALLTPHWVEADAEPAMSINLSHGGLRLHGRLAPFEAELEAFRQANPEQAPAKVQGVY